jgi:diphosphomevalonate decarboxylase
VSTNLFTSSIISGTQKYSGQVSWQSPSNIALVKYWGKFGVQLPKNASLSFGLSKAYSKTSINFSTKTSEAAKHRFLFEGKENPAFGDKVLRFLNDLDLVFPFLKQLDLQIDSENSFPHSAGIASSASSMSALALCLCSIEQEVIGSLQDENDFYTKASFVARLGSGSASRSVYSGFSIWGAFFDIIESSNDYAVPFTYEVHPLFMQLRDSILIVSDIEKAISSRAGHALMNGHPYADARIAQSKQNLSWLLTALQQGDTDRFIEVVENEAMSLHGLMMSSKPWYSLLHPNTLRILEKIRAFREKSGVFVTFTLDAGPNVHLLYTNEDEIQVMEFIEKELLDFCVERKVIHDHLGFGPKRIK